MASIEIFATDETRAQRRAAWLAERRTMITGTDAAAILGISKFSGPFDVWASKTGKAPPEDPSAAIQGYRTAGHRMERTILEWYADVRGCGIQFADSFTVISSQKYPLIGATLDATRLDNGCPVDAKNIRFKTDDWGEEGTDQFPMYYGAQGIFQMHATDKPRFELPVLFSGQDFNVYELERDAIVEEDIISRCLEWWDRHVVTDTPPAIDGSKSATEFLKRLRQKHDGVVVATPQHDSDAKDLVRIRAQLKDLETQKDELENRMREAIGDGKTLSGMGWYALWSQAKDTLGVDWEKFAAHYVPVITNDMTEPFTGVIKKGGRRFTFNAKGLEK